METRKLWRNGDFIIVNVGGAKEKALLAEGWGETPEAGRKAQRDSGDQGDDDGLDEMTVAELREHAKERGIPIPAAATVKAAIVETIRAAEAGKGE